LQNIQGMESVEAVEPVLIRTHTLSSDQYATVAELAEQCPYEYGPAVYMARALLLRNDRLPRTYRNACENSGKRDDEEGGITSDEEERSYKLYPNPNTGAFSLVLSMDDQDIAELCVWSISGQQVHTQQLGSGFNTVNMEVAGGLYLYSITLNGIPEWTGKISVSSY
jgi:hypothetical protein